MEVVMKNLLLNLLFATAILTQTYTTKAQTNNEEFGMYVAKAVFFKWKPKAIKPQSQKQSYQEKNKPKTLDTKRA